MQIKQKGEEKHKLTPFIDDVRVAYNRHPLSQLKHSFNLFNCFLG